MAGATSAASAVVSKLGALLQEEEDDEPCKQLSRGARRDVALAVDAIRATRDLVSVVAQAEEDEEERDELSSLGGGAIAIARKTVSLLWKIKGLEDHPCADGYCAKKLRELCYDAEDSADAFAARPPPTRRRRWWWCGGGGYAMGSSEMAAACRRVARELGALRRVAAPKASASRRRGGVPPPPPRPGGGARRRVGPSVVVGVDDARDKLVEVLLRLEQSPSPGFRAVAIVGHPGAGKTTLAGEVFRAIGARFDCRAWVSASGCRCVNGILVEILRQVEAPQALWEGGGDLKAKAKEFLQNRRYLVVLDDVAAETTWDRVMLALPSNDLGSAAIMTTWLPYGLAFARTHYIRSPRWDCSKMLFYRRIFGSDEQSCPGNLVDIARKIFNKCVSSPLGITVISGLLANKRCSRSVWEGVERSISPIDDPTERMKCLCLIGYYDLPRHLKACLLYMRLFPLNYRFRRDRIVRSWVAEGFIFSDDRDEHGVTLEEAGEGYFDELVDRGMIQPAPPAGSYDDGTKAEDFYTLHFMFFCIISDKLARDNFVTLLENGKTESWLHNKIRRLSITSDYKVHAVVPETMDISWIRSLHVFGGFTPNLSFRYLTFLRVLDLEGCKDLKNHDVVEIAGLVHLRFLSIRDTPVSEIPDQIGQLRNLTTLDLRETEVQELPTSVVKLQRLAHLLCDKMRFPEWIGKMTSLSCLTQLDILQSETPAVEELGNLSELRELEIWWSPCHAAESSNNNTEIHEQFAFSLYRLKKLRFLRIRGGDSPVDLLDHLHHPIRCLQRIQLSSSCYLSRIPEWFRTLPMLSHACIDVEEVKNEDLQILSELPSLRHLLLSSRAVPTEKLVIGSNGFPVLQEFQLGSVRADIRFEPQAMQKVEVLLLSLRVLPDQTFDGFPISIDQFGCLKKLEIRIDSKGADADANVLLELAAKVGIRKAAENHPNLPSINIMLET